MSFVTQVHKTKSAFVDGLLACMKKVTEAKGDTVIRNTVFTWAQTHRDFPEILVSDK